MAESRQIARERHPDVVVRRSIRIISMLSELHKAGFQRLRAMPHMARSGCYWRCLIAPASAFHSNHGALVPGFPEDSACWTSGMEDKPFDWNDAGFDGARELAAKFVRRFPDLAKLGEGWDYAYAGWHLRVLGLAERGWLPVVFDDDRGPSCTGLYLIDCRPTGWREKEGDIRPHLPMPPPGDLPDEATLIDKTN